MVYDEFLVNFMFFFMCWNAARMKMERIGQRGNSLLKTSSYTEPPTPPRVRTCCEGPNRTTEIGNWGVRPSGDVALAELK